MFAGGVPALGAFSHMPNRREVIVQGLEPWWDFAMAVAARSVVLAGAMLRMFATTVVIGIMMMLTFGR